MRGVYDASALITSLVAAKTLLYITVPSTKIVEILSAAIENYSNAASEQMLATWQKVNSLGTPTATTLTCAKHEDGDAAAGSVVKANVTALEPSYVADTELGRKGFPSVAGYFFGGAPEERIYIPPSATYGLRLIAPAVPVSFHCLVRCTFREIG